jgi:hypothetical protein
VLIVSTAQVVFSVALGAIAVIIALFGAYVTSSTLWGDRWVRRRR